MGARAEGVTPVAETRLAEEPSRSEAGLEGFEWAGREAGERESATTALDLYLRPNDEMEETQLVVCCIFFHFSNSKDSVFPKILTGKDPLFCG